MFGIAMAASLALVAVSDCQAGAPQGYANNRAGRVTHAEMCRSMRTFVRAHLDDTGLRRAWFLPFGNYDDGSFDFYAPMGANPGDDASHAFYEHRVGQLTHYLLAPEFAEALMSCLTRSEGFRRASWVLAENEARGEVRDARSKRRIVIRAKDSTTAILIADEKWHGDLEANLIWPGCETQPASPPDPSLDDSSDP